MIFLQGVLIGFSIAAPVGPIGVLCIQRTLARGRLIGFVSGLGAATADALYGCVAGFGLTFISSLLMENQVWLRLTGGIFLCYLGMRTFIVRPSVVTSSTHSAESVIGNYVSTLFLTLTNPTTILSLVAIFAGLGIGFAGSGSGAATVFVLGVFCSSAAWWLILSTVASLLRQRLSGDALRVVNRLSGIIILFFGVIALVSFFPSLYARFTA